jgi:hypothetical protein
VNENFLNEGCQIPHNFISSSGSGTVINYGSGSDFLTRYYFGSGAGSTSQKVTVPTDPIPVPQRCKFVTLGVKPGANYPNIFLEIMINIVRK